MVLAERYDAVEQSESESPRMDDGERRWVRPAGWKLVTVTVVAVLVSCAGSPYMLEAGRRARPLRAVSTAAAVAAAAKAGAGLEFCVTEVRDLQGYHYDHEGKCLNPRALSRVLTPGVRIARHQPECAAIFPRSLARTS